jgi:hypothetical protein
MRLLLIQLSDLHIRSENDFVLKRAEQIAAAIKSTNYRPDLCVFVISGDIAYSGEEGQYLLALDLLALIERYLKQEFLAEAELRYVVVPGNHDCLLAGSHQVRNLVLDSPDVRRPEPPDSEIVSMCTSVQANAFQFRNALDAEAERVGDNLYYEYLMSIGDSSIIFRCCNTAWLSRQHEQPAMLFYPTGAIRDRAGTLTLAVSIFHHPYGWLDPTNARQFRKRIEQVSNIILTGHEHDHTLREQRTKGGEVTTHIEGSALQANDQSGFVVICVDTEQRHHAVMSYEWTGDLYATQDRMEWREYPLNQGVAGQDYEITPDMRETLADPGITIHHASHERVVLDDIYVYPDMVEVAFPPKDHPDYIRGESIRHVAEQHGRVLITGMDRSGKTCLAKRLFRDYYQAGYVPILLDGAQLRLYDDERIYDTLREVFRSQYTAPTDQHYMQLDRAKRVILIDEYENIRTGRNGPAGALARVSDFASQVVLIAYDLAQQVGEIAGGKPISEGRAPFIQFRIIQYGHLRRAEIAERWFLLDPAIAGDSQELARKVMTAKRMMDTAIGKNFVPSYPIFLLAILQAIDHSEQINLGASTYGYFYEILIRKALLVGTTAQGLDVKLGFLAHFAYSVFIGGTKGVEEARYRDIVSEYEKGHLIRFNASDVFTQLLHAGILARKGNLFEFKYAYIYYYFVACYFRDHMNEGDVRDHIARLARGAHREENANILLFLAHVSRDPVILDAVLQNARGIFPGSEEVDLSSRQSLLPELEEVIREVVYEEKRLQEARTEALAKLDTIERERERRKETEEALVEVNSFAAEVSRGFRTLQILGQVLKNFPGTIEAERKKEIAEACYALGLRTLGALYGLLRERRDEYLLELIETIREEDPDLTERELSERAQRSMYTLTHIAGYATIRRISSAIGSPYLAPIYEAIFENHATPAVALVNTSIQLDQDVRLPERRIAHLAEELKRNPYARHILTSLVVNHFYMYDVPFDVKQKVCAALEIKYKPLQVTNPRPRLIGRQSADGKEAPDTSWRVTP